MYHRALELRYDFITFWYWSWWCDLGPFFNPCQRFVWLHLIRHSLTWGKAFTATPWTSHIVIVLLFFYKERQIDGFFTIYAKKIFSMLPVSSSINIVLFPLVRELTPPIFRLVIKSFGLSFEIEYIQSLQEEFLVFYYHLNCCINVDTFDVYIDDFLLVDQTYDIAQKVACVRHLVELVINNIILYSSV